MTNLSPVFSVREYVSCTMTRYQHLQFTRKLRNLLLYPAIFHVFYPEILPNNKEAKESFTSFLVNLLESIRIPPVFCQVGKQILRLSVGQVFSSPLTALETTLIAGKKRLCSLIYHKRLLCLRSHSQI